MASDLSGPYATDRAAGGRVTVAACLALLVLALLGPGLFNRDPLLFPDSIGYYHAGEAALGEVGWKRPRPAGHPAAPMPTMVDRATDTISTSRSVYYGIFFAVAYALLGTWGLPLAQAVIVVVALWLALRRLTAATVVETTVAIAALGLVAGLGVFTATAMPDVFTGLLILALALVLPGQASPRERLFWLAVILAACLFHKANLALAAVIVVAFAAWLAGRRQRLTPVVAPVAVLAVAFLGHAAVGMVVERLTHRPPVEIPFLLARTVGDHTADPYLRRHCPGDGLAICAYVDRLPMTSDEFLWSDDPKRGLFKLTPPAERATIAAQANTVVFGAFRERPFAQIKASAANFADQLVNVGATQFGFGPVSPPEATPALRPLLVDYRASRVGQREMPLVALSGVMLGTYLAAAAVLLGLAATPRRATAGPARGAVVWLLLGGVVANAAVSGIIAGSYDRYQGRVAWLVLFTAICAVLWRRERGPANG